MKLKEPQSSRPGHGPVQTTAILQSVIVSGSFFLPHFHVLPSDNTVSSLDPAVGVDQPKEENSVETALLTDQFGYC